MEKKTNKKTIDDFNYLANAASAMDCTGLILLSLKQKKSLSPTMTSYSTAPPPLQTKQALKSKKILATVL